MQELIRTALLNADQAEVYTSEDSSDSIGFSDGKLDAVDTSLSSALALRIIKDGKIGFAHTRNLLEPKHLVKQALLSAENGMEARFDFPHTTSVPSFDTYDPAIEIVSKDELIQRGRELLDYVKSQTDAQMNLNFGYSTSKSSLANSTGTQLSRSESSFGMFTQLIFPGTGSGLMKFKRSQSPVWLGRQDLDEIIQLYEISRQQIVPATGKMPVIFHAQALYSLIWRLDEAINAANIFNKVSPLCGRTGEQLL
ncbi:MAG: DNA gyrase modulator, partial [Candidatus Cloacimonadaceae bacterium]|nr:DNA gyrase modulator [Candidatus Cloacimonadaceae bacterium]